MSQLVAINAAASINSEDDLRELEHARLRALVEGNIALARHLHADDFHLVTPIGRSYSKDRYLSEIENGALRYHSWVPGAMQVRSFGSTAVLRYQATLELDSGGGRTPPFRCWHIDSYELINGLWQVVWSQATSVRP